ncbi:PEP-CTERM sorting domain-containing protein [Nitrosospira briensis]|uniref:PEP-CTERM sorting domain-containing protein n=1 Tax=Nitrosospira briensis TaxID=35799 RepID=UPI00046865B4|nr:PEP-CTERM sorting domain-containing protein [Nitrosospira briensis]
MNKLVSATAVFGILLIAISPARAAPIYTIADFSGGVSTVTGLGNSLGFQQTSTCSGCAAGSVGGQVLFDKSLIPASGTDIVNIALASIAGVSNHDIFNIVLGSKPLGFEFGDINVTGSPSIQFKDGVFNGFSFMEDFVVNGKTYEFSMQGSAWAINWLKSNSSSDFVASGYVTIGSAGLFNQATLFPSLPELPATAVPEPATFALFGIGLLGIVMTRRRMARR